MSDRNKKQSSGMNDILNDDNIQIIRSKRRSLGLEVRPDGSVVVRIPNRLSKKQLMEFFVKHKAWIDEKRHYMMNRQDIRISTNAVKYDELTAEERLRIKDTFVKKAAYYSQIMGVSVGNITIRNQKTRWGSCSSKGNLNFNYQLYYMPEELMDYVVIHELAHRRYMNHSEQFWAEVEKYCPDYRSRRNSLRLYRLEV